ncbi:hypothetical protein DSO57_1034324 [Entomophthora muscae]|uniref:Uncharacterized protein n=1 Tax=Entomophthora muscae TaxID=34485 RepID=A0ACC2REP9_9FUNG|nr:hypothetical protein DSO57_1034324 [Entomophthora muscae]
MELQRKGTMLVFDAGLANIVCDQCSASHVKCSREAPVCRRCSKSGHICTRKRTLQGNRIFQTLSKAGWTLQPSQVQISSWSQVIENCNLTPLQRFYLCRHLLPMESILPRPTEYKEILKISSDVYKIPQHLSSTRKSLQLLYFTDEISNTLKLASSIFFYVFNPFYPLFSEEAFHSHPRSDTLKKLVIQIGLERMSQTEVVREAIQTNNLTESDLLNLPNTLDSLQCLLLVQFGSRIPWLSKTRFKIFCITNRLITLLGLHKTPPSSPLWLERTLALHLTSYGEYSLSVAQSLIWHRYIWVNMDKQHLNSNFLPRIASFNQFLHLTDRIHYITSQTIYHSFTIVLTASRDHLLAVRGKRSTAPFIKKLNAHLNTLTENFRWGWNNLEQLVPRSASQKLLLRRSLLTLTLRYNNDHIELSKLFCYIPQNSSHRISKAPLTFTINSPSQRGMAVAINTIQLAATITPSSFGLDYIHILIPSLAFLIAHTKPFKKTFGYSDHFQRSLLKAKHTIARGKHVTFTRKTATVCLDLIDFLLSHHKFSPHLPTS